MHPTNAGTAAGDAAGAQAEADEQMQGGEGTGRTFSTPCSCTKRDWLPSASSSSARMLSRQAAVDSLSVKLRSLSARAWQAGAASAQGGRAEHTAAVQSGLHGSAAASATSTACAVWWCMCGMQSTAAQVLWHRAGCALPRCRPCLPAPCSRGAPGRQPAAAAERCQQWPARVQDRTRQSHLSSQPG